MFHHNFKKMRRENPEAIGEMGRNGVLGWADQLYLESALWGRICTAPNTSECLTFTSHREEAKGRTSRETGSMKKENLGDLCYPFRFVMAGISIDRASGVRIYTLIFDSLVIYKKQNNLGHATK